MSNPKSIQKRPNNKLLPNKKEWTESELNRDRARAAANTLNGAGSVAASVLLLVSEVAALLREGDEVGKGHPAEADVIDRISGIGLDVFGVVIVDPTLAGVLHVADGEVGFEVSRQFLHLQRLDLVVECPQRHFRFLRFASLRDGEIEMNLNGGNWGKKFGSSVVYICCTNCKIGPVTTMGLPKAFEWGSTAKTIGLDPIIN